MRELNWTVPPADDGRTVRVLVPRRFALGQHAFRRLKVRGGILVNGEAAHADRVLHAGDRVTVLLEDSLEGGGALPEGDAMCRVRYLDDDLLIVAKGAPLATLPGIHQHTGTLRELLAAQLGISPDAFKYHPVNRLDKGTSGLLAVARHDHAQRLLTAQLHTDAFRREYLAIAEGCPEAEEGVIDAPIARTGEGARRCVREDGKPAVTHYKVEARCGSRCLLRLRLETGRTHQIRVHLAHIGCPIAGDYLYGTELPELPDRFALHSALLVCRQPLTGEEIRIEEPLPEELERLMQ